MIEDKLDRAERIRLEALAQSVAANAIQRHSPEKVIDDAKKFADFITKG